MSIASIGPVAPMMMVLVLGAAPALAADTCQPMTLTSDDTNRSVTHIDINENGASRGDLRIGTRRLLDEAGQEIGYRRWIAIALDGPDSTGGEVFASLVLSLANGQIHLQTLAATSRTINETDTSLLQPEDTGVVIGGTGAFEFARGSYTSHRDGELRTYRLNIRCD